MAVRTVERGHVITTDARLTQAEAELYFGMARLERALWQLEHAGTVGTPYHDAASGLALQVRDIQDRQQALVDAIHELRQKVAMDAQNAERDDR